MPGMYPRQVPNIRPVILSGGSGTRLWPISTPALPKQFAALVPGPSLFERTLLRLSGLEGVEPPFVVTGENQVDLVREAAGRVGIRVGLILIEPEGRNTAPAALAAALAADPEDTLVILPSDHLIQDTEGFTEAVRGAAKVASAGHIVTFGITPRSPETGYGYIEIGDEVESAYLVRRFKEKPDREEAERLVGDGKHLWNSGMFVASASLLIEEARTHCPDLLDGVRSAMTAPAGDILELAPGFADLEKISLDHAIMERTRAAAVIALDLGWDDVGSFEALWAVSGKDDQGNAIFGDVMAVDSAGSLISATSRRVAVIGIEDMVVVETPDTVLVVPRERSQEVKRLAEGSGSD